MKRPAAVALGVTWAVAAAANAATQPAAAKAPQAFEDAAQQAAAARTAGNAERAIAFYEKALTLNPSWTDGHWALATLLYDTDQNQAAREHFRYVVAAQRQNGLAWAMTGLSDVKLKEYETAFADLQQARQFGISDPEIGAAALLQTALLVNRSGNPDAAFEMLREFAAKGADTPPVIAAFGLSMLRLRYMPEEVPADKRPMVLLAGRGGYHMARGRRTPVGRLALEELVSRYPAEPNVHYAWGAYLAPDEPAAAIEEFQKELRAQPDHYAALIQIAALRTRLGNAIEALPLAEKAVGLAPEVPAARLTLGRALLDLGETQRAVVELEKGAALAPASPEIQFALARAYQKAGRAEDAARAREEFLRLEKIAREHGGSV